MSRGYLAREVKKRLGESLPKKRIERILAEAFEVIKGEVLAGREVSIKDFGRFYLKPAKARRARSPQTGEEIRIPARKKFSFNPSRKIKFVEE